MFVYILSEPSLTVCFAVVDKFARVFSHLYPSSTIRLPAHPRRPIHYLVFASLPPKTALTCWRHSICIRDASSHLVLPLHPDPDSAFRLSSRPLEQHYVLVSIYWAPVGHLLRVCTCPTNHIYPLKHPALSQVGPSRRYRHPTSTLISAVLYWTISDHLRCASPTSGLRKHPRL
jgi:hypothetical protein